MLACPSLMHASLPYNRLTGLQPLRNAHPQTPTNVASICSNARLGSARKADPGARHVVKHTGALQQGQLTSALQLGVLQNGPLASTRMSAPHPLGCLDLAHNDICSLADVIDVLTQLPSLRALHLSGNPVCLAPGYRLALVTALPTLEFLDGEVRRGSMRLVQQRCGHFEVKLGDIDHTIPQ